MMGFFLSGCQFDADLRRSSGVENRIFQQIAENRFERLSDEFTERMKKTLTPEFQRQSEKVIAKLFGNLKAIEFVEAVKAISLPDVVIYRFRGTFTKTSERPELRVVINKEGKVEGFWIKDWHDELR